MTGPLVKIRITNADFGIEPRGPYDNTSLSRVPILRVFGQTTTGYKACVHIHQVYPYFYVEYNGAMSPDAVNQYIIRLQKSLNHAVAISLRRDPERNRTRYIRAIHIVKGVHFYGFHCSYSPFLKIYIVDPQHSLRIATILRSGGVMGQRFQVFESHLSFILQFMCDFGLYGCGELEVAHAYVRERKPEEAEVEGPDTSMFDLSSHPRQSNLPLELDVEAYHILNPRLLAPRNIHSTLTIPAPAPPLDPLVLSVRELWEDERKRRTAKGLPPTPVMPSDGSGDRGPGPLWRAEPRLRADIRARIEKEAAPAPESIASSPRPWEAFVMTAFESRGALWPPEFRTWKRDTDSESPFQTPDDYEAAPKTASRSTSTTDDTTDIDEGFLRSQRVDDLMSTVDAAVYDEKDSEPEEDLFDGDDEAGDARDANGTPKKPGRQAAKSFPTPTSGTSRSRPKDNIPTRNKSRDSSPFRPHSVSARQTPGSAQKRSNPFSAQSWHDLSDRESPTKLKRTPSLSRKLSSISLNLSSNGRSPSRSTSRSSVAVGNTRSENVEEAAWTPTIPATEIVPSSGNPQWTPTIPQTEPDTHEAIGTPADPQEEPGLTTTNRAEQPRVSQGSASSVVLLLTPEARQGDPQDGPPSPESPPIDQKSAVNGVGLGLGNLGPFERFPNPTPPKTQLLRTTPGDRRPRSTISFVYPLEPPDTTDVLMNLVALGLKEKIYRDPYYSNVKDIPKRPREYAGRLFTLRGGTGIGSLEEWTSDLYRRGGESYDLPRADIRVTHRPLRTRGVTGWEYAGNGVSTPPSRRAVVMWLDKTDGPLQASKSGRLNSQILGPTQKNRYGFKATQGGPKVAASRERQNMSVLSIEVLALSRGSLLPHPEHDRIEAIFYAFQEEDVVITEQAERRASYEVGCLAINSAQIDKKRMRDASISLFDTELDVFNALIDRVREWDPDILTGWEIQNGSWGYIAERAWKEYSLSVSEEIARIISTQAKGGNTAYDSEHTSTFRVAGRHVFNTWRIMRVEQTLSHYTMENVVFHVLRRRVPRYSAETLTRWLKSDKPEHTARTLRHFVDRTAMVLEVLDEAQVVTKNAEFARVFGVEFFSVLSRGSQFKVESFMFRIAKPESLMLLSPSREDVGGQNAAECIPLIMEPKSAYYKSPLVVLDFQSLYPSIMIAYNYCYSTCLGRVGSFKGKNKLGVLADLKLPEGLLGKVEEHIIVAPNGMMYVNPTVRKSLLAKMLTELLETRVMVKQAMKTSKDDKALLRVLDARQLSLKFICNVTYGYTSASFSGRMPAVEIADSIVQSGRETLERAITTINTTAKWGAKVVYGDTDSLFVSLEGKTKEQAFLLGNEMADAITAMNPRPVKLKFEKVYFPCLLMAKKRYVGFKYEHPDDVEPVFDAKGIETVRRDGIPAGQKMVEKCIKTLFRSQDLSEVKSYCQSSWAKLMEGRASVQDFIFAKEVRMGKYSDKGPPPPGVVVAARRVTRDPRAEAQYGDRIPYVITRGEPKSRLVDRAFEPLDVLKDRQQYQLDAAYYIEHQLIPPIERVLNLVGANVASWYAEMPKVARPTADLVVATKGGDDVAAGNKRKFTIDEHFKMQSCIVCGRNASQAVCPDCRLKKEETIYGLQMTRHRAEKRAAAAQTVCASCCGVGAAEETECDSIDCAWLFERYKAGRELEATKGIGELVEELVNFNDGA